MTTRREETRGSRRLAAVWFADIVGFTRLFAENEPLALRLVEVLQTTATAAVEGHEGNVVKFMGDGVLAEFASARGAALGAMQLLLRFGLLTESWPEGPHQLRLGLHLGDVAVGADGDIYGDGVNRASRLEGLAEPGKLLVSEDVYRQLRSSPDLVLTDLGSRSVKGYDDPLRVYNAEPTEELARSLLRKATTAEASSTGPSPGATSSIDRPSRSVRPIAIGTTVGILTFVALAVWTALGPGSSRNSDVLPLGPGASAEHAHADSFSIAVLPFRYLSSDQSHAYIADGISEELIHALSSVPELRVASRTSSFQYRDAEMDVAVLAARLGVLMVLEGRVQKVDDDLRVTAQLIDADHGGMQIWSYGWESKTDDVLSLQTSIAQAVVNALLNGGGDATDATMAVVARASSPGGAGAGSTPAPNPEAHDLLLRGRHELARGTAAGVVRAAEIFTQAITLAPDHARAHLGLAEAQIELGKTGVRPLAEVLPQAREHLDDALRYDPDLAQAHATLATFLGTFQWDWERAESEFETALELAPTPAVHRAFAELLSARGRHDEALAQAAMAFRQEPGAVANVAAQGMTLFRARNYVAARVVLGEALRLDPTDDRVRIHLARTQETLGERQEARLTLDGADPANRSPSLQIWRARLRVVGGGDRMRGDQLLRTIRGNLDASSAGNPDAPYYLAALRLSLGDPSGALGALRRAMRTPSPSLIWLPTDPMWDAARSAPQFQQFVRRIDAGRRAR
ncbi:MAG: tetratricopeptide repeat protein [Longimicrobiales bacterium]